MLTEDQRHKILQGFSKGVPDTIIAENLDDVTHMQVYMFRRKLKISRETILDNRYNTWIKMIQDGIDPKIIGPLYGVKPASVSIMLSRRKGFAVSDALREAQERRNERFVEKRSSSKDPFGW